MKKLINSKFDLLEKRTHALLIDLKKIPISKLNQPEAENKWSIIQVLNHLVTSESSSLGYMQKKILGKDSLKKVGLAGSVRMFIFKLSQLSSRRFKAPDYVAQPSNEENLDQIIERWNIVRKNIAQFIDQYPDELVQMGIMKHPFAGRITLGQTLDFFSYHMIHHQIQIGRIKKSSGK